jgi:hypothetical protein
MRERFGYKGVAVGVSGRFTVPFSDIIEVQATSALTEIGGYGSARSVDFSYRDILRFNLAHSLVVGSECCEDGAKPHFSTLVKSTVEGLNFLDMVTADRIVANVVSTYTEEVSGEPTIRLIGSRFENLRVAGIPVKVIQATDVLDKYGTYTSLHDAYPSVDRVRGLFGEAALRARLPEAPPRVSRWFSHLAEPGPEMPVANDIARGSMVLRLEPESAGLDCWGHVINVEGFGTIRLAEVTISRLSRAVTMLQIDTCCPVKGRVMFCMADGGINPG